MDTKWNNKAHSDIFLLDSALMLRVFAVSYLVFGDLFQDSFTDLGRNYRVYMIYGTYKNYSKNLTNRSGMGKVILEGCDDLNLEYYRE